MRRMPVLALFLLALGPGCASQDNGGSRVKVYPVEGKLFVWGRPAADASIGFHPVDKDRTGGHIPVGISTADGSFRLMTYIPEDGAPEGEYAITIYWPHDPSLANACACDELQTHDRFYGRYSDPAKSELRVTIRPEHNDVILEATVNTTGWNLPPLKAINKPNTNDRPRNELEERNRERDR